ncbi:hypothetical protein BC832DRAFT_563858 [Gaertneriomyces semiglobifer]|nr:hypothetical protein BC832DRAFT_563858 [Gaertneriomyces semiglobifer]
MMLLNQLSAVLASLAVISSPAPTTTTAPSSASLGSRQVDTDAFQCINSFEAAVSQIMTCETTYTTKASVAECCCPTISDMATLMDTVCYEALKDTGGIRGTLDEMHDQLRIAREACAAKDYEKAYSIMANDASGTSVRWVLGGVTMVGTLLAVL